MTKLHELIEEQVAAFEDKLTWIFTDDDGNTDHKNMDYVRAFIATALKEIALQSIEAVSLEEETMDAALKSGSDAGAGYTIGHNYAVKEAKQRAGVFLGEANTN